MEYINHELEAIVNAAHDRVVEVSPDGDVRVSMPPALMRVALAQAAVILANLARENPPSRNPFRQRWPISHEPLRSDARGWMRLWGSDKAAAEDR